MANQKTIEKINGIDMNVLQSTVNAIQQDPDLGKCKFRVSNKWLGGNHNCTTITDFYGAKQENNHLQPFELHADEPPILAGADQGPNPVEHLLNALAGCLTTAMVAHAAVRGIHIEELESEIEGDIDINGYLGLSKDVPKEFTDIRVKFKVKTDVENMERLKRLAGYSPVYNTLIHGTNVDIQIEPK
ncbi:MAG: OsmC family protein [Candidatus Hydrogenedentota bacterium]|jgi:uncharacterized OsmC-like protein|nr:MAG: OsmC family protein [Candidatus Hydrogenedentota bacterium]